MKKTYVAVAALVVILAGVTLNAVGQERVLAHGDIPFSFTAHERTFQPGEYRVRQISDNFVRIEHVRSAEGVTLLSPQAVAAGKSIQLVFRSYGSQRFLAEVVAPTYKIALPASEAELEASRSGAKATQVALEVKR